MDPVRRALLGAAACGLLCSAAPVLSAPPEPLAQHRTLDLYRPATGERFAQPYIIDGQWAGNAYEQLCWLMRDVKAGQAVRMDPVLIALVDWTQQYVARFGYHEPLHILSGYRSPQTNQSTEGAALRSQHLYGRALDIRVPGLSVKELARLMDWLVNGGVGVYLAEDFLHIDTGPLRRWAGAPTTRPTPRR